MFGLTRDFMQQDGVCMMLGEPGGMPVGRLNMVQARMLMNSSIPHHLRLRLKELDLKATLEYSVSRKKMLSHLLKSEKLSLTACFGLLLQIAQGMEDGRLYMLKAEQYALHEDYIFIEGTLQTGKVYLTYIPLQNYEPAVLPGESFKSLIMVFMASITELTGGGLQRLLQFCGEEEFTPAGLKALLAELLTEDETDKRHCNGEGTVPVIPLTSVEPTESVKPAYLHSNEMRAREAVVPARKTMVRPEESPVAANPYMTPWVNSVPSSSGQKEEGRSATSSQGEIDDASKSSSQRTYALLGCLLGDALLWKFLYLNNPTSMWLAVCGIATLVLAVISWMVWCGRIQLGRPADKEEEMEGDNEETKWARSRKELEWDFGRNPVAPVRSSLIPKVGPQRPMESLSSVHTVQPEEKMDEGNHSLKAPVPAQATVLLSRDMMPEKSKETEKPKQTAPYLERCDKDEGGDAEKIELNRTSFIIGRSAEVAQYVEKSEGASRVHAEISRSQGGYVLKDLDSRNGTLFQGEAMIPYKEYPLTEGTVFTIVKGSYTFRTA